MGGKIKRSLNIGCSYSQSGLCISFKREYLTAIYFMNVVLNSKEIPKSKPQFCLALGSEVLQSPVGTSIVFPALRLLLAMSCAVAVSDLQGKPGKPSQLNGAFLFLSTECFPFKA